MQRVNGPSNLQPPNREDVINSDQLSRWLTLGANIGVIAGIAFLAFELHQNNQLLVSQANLELSENRASANELMATNEKIAELLTGVDGAALTDVDLFRRERFYVMILTRWEWEYRQYLGGFIEEQYLPVSDWSAILNAFPGMKAVWAEDRNRGRSPEFVRFIDEEVLR